MLKFNPLFGRAIGVPRLTVLPLALLFPGREYSRRVNSVQTPI